MVSNGQGSQDRDIWAATQNVDGGNSHSIDAMTSGSGSQSSSEEISTLSRFHRLQLDDEGGHEVPMRKNKTS